MTNDEIKYRAETAEEKALRKWFAKQALAAVDNLEAAARSILGLVSALLGVLFAVLAVAADPLPAYLESPLMRGMGVIAVSALLLALLGALAVVLPQKIQVSSHRPDQQAQEFQALLDRKSRLLTFAVYAFGLGLAALAAALIIALVTAS
jgi:hypothetical protein